MRQQKVKRERIEIIGMMLENKTNDAIAKYGKRRVKRASDVFTRKVMKKNAKQQQTSAQ